METKNRNTKTIKNFLEYFDESLELWFHGSDKNLSGKIKPDKAKKTWDNITSFNDIMGGFFVTKDLEWAKIYTKKNQIYNIHIRTGYKYLDLSNIEENTHLVNRLISTGKSAIETEFLFQEKFNSYAFDWLNRSTKFNNRREISKKEYHEREIHRQFYPNDEDWFGGGIGLKALVDYIKDNNYDSLMFKREMFIINVDIVEKIYKT